MRQGLLPDRYTGPQPVGRGGMGEIYRATDTSLGRAVAVKVLDERYARDESIRARFTREALAAARLSGNPNIVTIYDVGEWNGRPFIVMEYLGGGSLEQLLRRDGAVAPQQALDWLEQTAHALDAAHNEGVVHRDVKPANLLLDRQGRVHVADFGIASAAGLDSLTQTGTVLGTASYLAPEQARGERTSPASDLYSLAVVAFELITGRRPFEADSVAAEAAAHVTGEVPSVCDVNPQAPCELDPVFARALAKDPAARFGSAAELVAALRAALAHAAPPTRMIYGRPRRRRAPWLVPLLVAALLAIGIGAAYALTRGGGRTAATTPPPQRPSVSVETVTRPGTTVQQTVTTAPPATTAAVSSGNGDALNAQAYGLMQQGRWQQALPLLQQAVQALQGQSGDVSDGYANYNLGITLIALGRCSEAIRYLQAAQQLEPGRPEVGRALGDAQRCAGGGGGSDHGRGGGGGGDGGGG